MTRRIAVAFAAAVLSLAAAGFASAQNVSMFSGSGKAVVVKENFVSARREALRQAKKAALEAALASALQAMETSRKRTQIEKTVLSTPDRFLISYKVAKDAQSDGSYEVSIEAKVDMDRLRKAVREIAEPAAGREAEPDRIVVIIAFEKQGKLIRYTDLEKEITSRFDMIGLRPTEEDATEAVFKSEVFANILRHRRFDEMVRLSEVTDLSLALVGEGVPEFPADACPKTGRFFFTDLKRRDVLLDFAYKFNTDLGCDKSAKEAAEEIFPKLTGVLSEKGLDQRGRFIKVTVRVVGLKEPADRIRLEKTVRSLPMVKSMVLQTFGTGGESEFLLEYEGRPEDFTEAATKADFVNFKLKEAVGPKNRLTFRAMY